MMIVICRYGLDMEGLWPLDKFIRSAVSTTKAETTFSFYPNKHVPTAAYQFFPALISNSLTSGLFIRVANTKAVLPLLS